MFEDFKKIFFSQTGKDTGVLFLGTSINVVIGGLFFILTPKILGPENYGIFAVVMATGLMVTNFANFGIDTGILRFLKTDTQENDKILKLAFKAYAILGLATLIIGFLFSNLLANILGVTQYANLLRISFIGVIFLLFTNFFIATLQTRKKFLESTFVNISSNVVRLLLLAVGAYFATINLYTLTLLFFFVTIISVVVGKFFVPLNFLKSKDEHLHFKNFFGYNFWVAASLAISTIPIDNYLLVKIAGPIATGIYAAPMKLLTTTYQFAGSYSRVLAPRMSSFDTKQKVINFAKKSIWPVIIICIGILLTNLVYNILVNIFWTQFVSSTLIFKILSIGMAFFFAETVPMAIILYYLGNSKTTFYITASHYIIYAALLFELIPKYSAIGASVTFTISEMITFLVLTGYTLIKLNEKDS